ncbi:kinase-like protein [Coccomyxa subellipsoidea C-169]|uniref:Kinase-like protein n=1 Tax=Coccomyxa subellipsoidea (strain C-169) TaxID=574566 RepID=I0YXU0_COCSC|nr:kinase-like protein [Coccomyxa subellipsoidea C-169]EIE23209.1 kinase-like protein [Coccomyxa subellipsoidea C-169]|eukprot:XP_005647753.1 kinase-like protein [Coccomyxa subellipsoidea C-169]
MGGLEGNLPPDVHIVGFGRTVNVFSSKQRPKELTIYGSDFKTYRWIVKGGEDVRTDERMEQILDVCNGLLARHPGAAAHQLQAFTYWNIDVQVRTYDVVPISSSLGIVEFVPGTQPLKESICTFLSDEVISRAWEKHSGAIWAMAKRPAPRAGEAAQPGVAEYLASFHADAADAAARLQATESDIRWDALREALLRNAGGPEEFLAMRANFAASLAAVSVTGYITGAGDRHTENFLLHRASGTLVPIDFGYSFGTGAQMLPIPELMPFRLTRQMRGALQPHDARELLRAPLALGLVALRSGSGVLEGILGVFLREPLADWQREARLLRASFRARGGEPPPDEDTHNAWHKLEGRHPSAILIAELTPKHSATKHWAALQVPTLSAGGNGGGTVLTPEEQADCLLDQATDGSILGRTWVGWRSWL